jgi:reactive intermediate/imine deaminase
MAPMDRQSTKEAEANPARRASVIKAGPAYHASQGPEYRPGVSAATAGATGLFLGIVTLSPGQRTAAHVHTRHESALYMLGGEEVDLWTGDRLEHHHVARPGDFIFIPANVPHVALNRSYHTPAVFVAARNEPAADEHVVMRPELEALAEDALACVDARVERPTDSAKHADREVISAAHASISVGPYSHAIRAGGFIFVSGQGALDPRTGRPIEGGIREQTTYVLRTIDAILKAAGSDLSRVVKMTVFLHDWALFRDMNDAYAAFFPEHPPARSTVESRRWPEGSLVAIEAIALAEPHADTRKPVAGLVAEAPFTPVRR